MKFYFTLKQLHYFVVTADSGSFVEAAKRLHVAQAAISSAITKLEQQFGTSLFVRRHAQGVTLTPAGQRLLCEARKLLTYSEDFQNKAHAEGGSLRGELSLGSYSTLGPVAVPKLTSKFLVEHPEVSFNLSEDQHHNLLESLKKGEIDAALVYDIDLSAEYEKIFLFEKTPYVLLPKGHALANKSVLSLEELVDESFIELNINPAKDYFKQLFLERKLTPKVTQKASSLEVLRGMVGWGLGVSILVTRPPSNITYDGLEIITRPIKDPIPPIKVYVVRLANSFETQLQHTFFDMCREYGEEHIIR